MEKDKGEPKAVFKITCPHCKQPLTFHATRRELKKYIKGIDKAAKRYKAT